jgi:hypothetical protein
LSHLLTSNGMNHFVLQDELMTEEIASQTQLSFHLYRARFSATNHWLLCFGAVMGGISSWGTH